MTPITDWLPFVLLPGCPQVIAVDAIRQTLRDFCERTFTWAHTQDPVTTYATEAEYPLEPPSKAEAVRILQAWFKGAPIEVRSPDEVGRFYRTGSWLTATGVPKHVVMMGRHIARVVPIPESLEADALVLRIAVRPDRDATDVCDELFDEHREAIAAGAKARLLMMPSQPFANAKQGALERAQYESAVADEVIQFWRGYSVDGQTAHNPHRKFA